MGTGQRTAGQRGISGGGWPMPVIVVPVPTQPPLMGKGLPDDAVAKMCDARSLSYTRAFRINRLDAHLLKQPDAIAKRVPNLMTFIP